MERRYHDLLLRLGITDDAILEMEKDDAIARMSMTGDASLIKAWCIKASNHKRRATHESEITA